MSAGMLQLVDDSVGVRTLHALRVLIYARVSDDKSGIGQSPNEQRAELERACERQSWSVVAVVVDNDEGASSFANAKRKGGMRRGVAEVMATVASGGVDLLLVWEASRLTRDLEEYVAFRRVLIDNHCRLGYGGSTYDLADPSDNFRVLLDIGLGELEAGKTSQRVRRHTNAAALSGQPHGRKQWGYRREYDSVGRYVRQVPDKEIASLVRELFKRVAKGDTFAGIARDFAARGVRSPSPDGKWRRSSWNALRQVTRSRAYLGERVHHGKTIATGKWPALVSVDLFERVQLVLDNPTRRTSTSTLAKHLLSGLLVCATCGTRCVQTRSHSRGVAHETYRCPLGHVSRSQLSLDAAVSQLLIARLERDDVLSAFTRGSGTELPDALQELQELTEQLEAAEDVMAGEHASARSVAAFERLEARLSPRVAELERLVAKLRAPVPIEVQRMAGGSDVAKRWARASLAEQRVVIRALLTLRLLPLGRGARGQIGLGYTWINGDEELTL